MAYDVKSLVRDPEFQRLPFNERRAVLAEADPEFGEADSGTQNQVLAGMKNEPWWGNNSSKTLPSHTPGKRIIPKSTGQKVKEYSDRIINPTVKNRKPESLSQFLTETVPASATKLVTGAVAAPYTMIKNVTDPLLTGQGLSGMTQGMRQNLEMAGRAIGEPLGLYGAETAKDRWQTDPVGSLAALAPVATAGGKLAKSGARTAGMVAEPILVKSAEKLTDMTLKQPTTLKPGVRDQNVRTALEGNFIPNSKGVDKLNAAITTTENKIASGIKAGEAAQVRGTFDKAIANLEALREEANISSDPVTNNALIDAEIVKMRENPLLDEAGSVDIGTVQKMKVAQGREIQKSYGEQKPQFQNQIDKARVRGLKEELELKLEEAFPELAATNKNLGALYSLKKSLDRAASRIENNQGIGIGLPIKSGAGAGLGSVFGPTGAAIGGGIGTLIGVIEHPSVAPRLAQQLYRASKGKISKSNASKITRRRIAEITSSIAAVLPRTKPKD